MESRREKCEEMESDLYLQEKKCIEVTEGLAIREQNVAQAELNSRNLAKQLDSRDKETARKHRETIERSAQLDDRDASLANLKNDMAVRETKLNEGRQELVDRQQALTSEEFKCTERSNETLRLLLQAKNEKETLARELAEANRVQMVVRNALDLPIFASISESKPKLIEETTESLSLLIEELGRLRDKEVRTDNEMAQMKMHLEQARSQHEADKADWNNARSELQATIKTEVDARTDAIRKQSDTQEKPEIAHANIQQEKSRLETELDAVREELQTAQTDLRQQEADFLEALVGLREEAEAWSRRM